MKHLLLFFTLLTYTASAKNDSLSFKGHIYNNVYNIYIKFNLYDNNIEVPGHELLGPLSGYLGKKNNNFFWLITNGEAKKNNKATLSFINDFGSEDFKAELIKKNPMMANLIKQNSTMLGAEKQKEVVEVIDKL